MALVKLYVVGREKKTNDGSKTFIAYSVQDNEGAWYDLKKKLDCSGLPNRAGGFDIVVDSKNLSIQTKKIVDEETGETILKDICWIGGQVEKVLEHVYEDKCASKFESFDEASEQLPF